MKIRSISFVVILLIIAGCKPAEQKIPVSSNAISVRVQSVEETEYKIPVRTTGILGTTTQMKLSFKTRGIIQKLNTREGASVSRGEVLAILDLSEIRAQVNQAQIGYEKAERDLSRAKNLYRDSVATLEQVQNARSAFELAKSQKQIADFNLSHSRIKAPSDGKIQKILVETNEIIGPGYPAILFASTENDWVVRSALTDKDIVKLSLGDSGLVTMDAFPGIPFKAEISELGSVADPVTGTYEVELVILESQPQFRTGFFSRVLIYPTETSRSMVVPIEALLDASDNTANVFVYEQGKAMMRRVKLGLLLEDRVVVTEGLEVGEFVITDGARYVRKDTEVNVLEQTDTPIQ